MINEVNTGEKSTLISGAAWDTTLQWMVNASENKNSQSNLGYDINLTDEENYGESISTTGYHSINNIYDMAGNVLDWTSENCIYNNINCTIARGGSYGTVGLKYPPAFRSFVAETAGEFMGFRVVIYKNV